MGNNKRTQRKKRAKRKAQLSKQQTLKILYRLGLDDWGAFLAQAHALGLSLIKAKITFGQCRNEKWVREKYRIGHLITYGHDVVSAPRSLHPDEIFKAQVDTNFDKATLTQTIFDLK